MTKAPNNRNLMVVELDEGVMVCTPISSDNHAALRSGFAGFTANPRWNASKFRAWRIGRQWRDALDRGDMVVRKADSMLVPMAEAVPDREPSEPVRRFGFPERLSFKNAFASLN